MTVSVRVGNLFDSKAQTLTNTVNTVGVMGKGIALEFKRRYPANYEDYKARCQRGEVQLGRPYVYRVSSDRWILNFPTKEHWRSLTKLDHIVAGLELVGLQYKEWGITSLAVPPLGCGLGQLEWRVVGPTLYRHLSGLEIPVELYAPYGTSHDELSVEFLDRRKTQASPGYEVTRPNEWIKPGWVALAEIVRRIGEEPYHWPIGRTMFQKIAYAAAVEGIPTGLEFSRGTYGPYATDLKRVQSRLLNNGLLEEAQRGRMWLLAAGPTLADARVDYAEQLRTWDAAIDRVMDLFTRMDTVEAERAASVMFAAHELAETLHAIPTESDVLQYVLEWKRGRRPRLEAQELAGTVRGLAALGWINVRASPNLPVADEVVQLA